MQKKIRQQLRKTIITQRSSLSLKQQQHASVNIAKKIIRMKDFIRSKRIAFYFASKGEIDTLFLLKKALAVGKECFFPILNPIKHNHMSFGHYELGDPLIKNSFGILEPDLKFVESIPPWTLDLVFTPLVAFDATGNRLGMGGGYYDHTFSFLLHRISRKPKLIGLAYDFQQLALLPSECWDIAMNVVVTESQVFDFQINK